ncbi:hypothetical protein Q644_20920 [Brucella intermedia 229E]|jgi:hypothetical protein|uniref:DUF2958 domain-containing protein n=1 Tax=Brucella intermedia 229E TaxID=1337887 RepID=U4VAB5_9HYPH|nr:hypothetical protein Q644_20920 [Brucella intermedia 229E]
MIRRFPRTETLIPDDLRAVLIANGRASGKQAAFDPRPVVKLFTPDGSATWLITEAYEEPNGDLRLFDLCDLDLAVRNLATSCCPRLKMCAAGLACRSNAICISGPNTGLADMLKSQTTLDGLSPETRSGASDPDAPERPTE